MKSNFFVIAFTLFLIAKSSFALTINISSGVPQGGFGDVASNLLMAELIKAERPEWQINFIVAPEALPVIHKLMPDLNSNRDLAFFLETDSPLPIADFLLGFSNADPANNDQIKKTAPIVLGFVEYGARKNPTTRKIMRSSRQKEGQLLLNFYAGLNSTGMYFLPEKNTALRISKDLSTYGIEPNTVVAFSYSSNESSTAAYREAVEKLALTSEYQGKEIILFEKDFEKSALKRLKRSFFSKDIPANFKINRYKSMPFHLTMALIQRANLPVLGTGDVSLSLILGSGKVPVYENISWTKEHLNALQSLIVSNSTYFSSNADARIMLQKALSISSESEIIFKVFKDIRFRKEFVLAVDQFRSTQSLPKNVVRLISNLHCSNFLTKQL